MNDTLTYTTAQDLRHTDRLGPDAVPSASRIDSDLPQPFSDSTPDEPEIGGETAIQMQIVQDETLLHESLTSKQLAALPFLIRPGTTTQQAMDAGISRATLYRWLRDPEFRATLERLRKETLRVAENEIQSMAHDAVSVIYELMHTGSQAVRLNAARSALKLAQDARFADRLAERIENLERAAELRKKSQWPGY